MSIRDCIDAVKKASGDHLSDAEALDMLDELDRFRRRQEAEGRSANLAEQLRRRGRDIAERVKRDAAQRRWHAALNIVARDAADRHIDRLVAQGLRRDKAVLALLEGTTADVDLARKSVMRATWSFENHFIAPVMGAISQDRSHLLRMLGDRSLNRDVSREMHQKAGDGPATQNEDAQFLARLYSEALERARRALNRLGADIGKLDGYLPHVHDDARVMKAGEAAWIRFTYDRLDIERTFGDLEPARIHEILAGMRRHIITGRRDEPTAAARGEYSGPANLARSFQQERRLHFRDADAWEEYNARFGRGDATTVIVEQLHRQARAAGMMQALGPNPEVMFRSILEAQKTKVDADPNLTEAQRQRITKALSVGDTPSFGIGAAFHEVSGWTLTSPHLTAARLMSGIRMAQAMAKLGAAVVSSLNDVVLNALNMTYRGKPLFQTYRDTLVGYARGRGGRDERTIAFLSGEGFQGHIDGVVTPYAALDTAPGMLHRATTRFFKLTGLTWWTDTGRSVAARVLAADMGRLARTAWDGLPPSYRRVLGQQGIDSPQWELIRRAAWKAENGTVYITPDRIAALDGQRFDSLFRAEITAARRRFSRQGRPEGAKARDTLTAAQQRDFDRWLASRRDKARLDLEIAYRGMIADESRFAIIGSDDPSVRRFVTLGGRPGTLGGEAARFVMQFKGFSVGFTRRVLGRAIRGHRRAGRRAQLAHSGHLIAGLMVAGYAAMTLKDLARGYEPRDPDRWQTILATMLQSGGLGIYGDFLFSKATRMGGGGLETLAGPAISAGSQGFDMFKRAGHDGDVSAGEWLSFALQNTPYINVWWARPAMDALVLNGLRDAASPGYLRRRDRSRLEDFGQERLIPATIEDF